MLFQKQLSADVFVNPTEQTKSCFYVIGCHFSECLFTFYLSLIEWYFLFQNLPRKLKIRNFFFSHLFWPLKSFFIQKKFPHGQKILPDFRIKLAQWWHLKKVRNKKLRIFNFLGGFSRKKKWLANQIQVKRKETFWKIAADNVKTAFRLPSEINEDFIRNLIWQHQQQQQQQENIIQKQQQNIKHFLSEGVSKYMQEKTCAEVSF